MSDHGKILKYFETKFRFVLNCFFLQLNSVSVCFPPAKFVTNNPIALRLSLWCFTTMYRLSEP